ncbi:hypothetical protein K439DRAFT_1625456 [Ramaria rubella]|nr:hypothetical protein K439DRAFT_1625456 [Ramaria rubella]
MCAKTEGQKEERKKGRLAGILKGVGLRPQASPLIALPASAYLQPLALLRNNQSQSVFTSHLTIMLSAELRVQTLIIIGTHPNEGNQWSLSLTHGRSNRAEQVLEKLPMRNQIYDFIDIILLRASFPRATQVVTIPFVFDFRSPWQRVNPPTPGLEAVENDIFEARLDDNLLIESDYRKNRRTLGIGSLFPTSQ